MRNLLLFINLLPIICYAHDSNPNTTDKKIHAYECEKQLNELISFVEMRDYYRYKKELVSEKSLVKDFQKQEDVYEKRIHAAKKSSVKTCVYFFESDSAAINDDISSGKDQEAVKPSSEKRYGGAVKSN